MVSDSETYTARIEQTFDCECGKEMRADKQTECKTCGAHYAMGDDPRGVMVQLAPPQGGAENWQDGEWVGE